MIKRFFAVVALHAPRNIFHYDLRRPTRCPVMTLIILLLGLFGMAHSAVLRGTVKSAADGRELQGVNVRLTNSAYGDATNQRGAFTIVGVPAGEWLLEISHLGFESQVLKITLAPADTASIDVSLLEQVVPLGEVVYTGTRTKQYLKDTPVATELVTGRDIQRRAALTAAEALQSKVGLDVQEDFSGQGVMLQGVDPDKVLILVDGRRVIGRVNGSIDLNQMSTVGVKQIEVVKGAASTLYGSEAIGGVINIVTAPALQPFAMTAEFEAGSHIPDEGVSRLGIQSADWTPGLTVGLKRGAVAALGGIRYRRQALVDLDPATTHTEGTDATDRLNSDLRLDYQLNPHQTLTFSGRFLAEEKSWVEDAGLVSVRISYDDEEVNSRRDLALEWSKQVGRNRTTASMYNTLNDHEWRKFTKPPFRRLKDFSSSRENYSEVSLGRTTELGEKHLLTSGVEYYYWDFSAASSLGGIRSDYGTALTAFSAYAQDEWRAFSGFALVPGLRFENHEVYGSNWSPRVSFMWDMASRLKVRGSLGYGYRAPSAKELYFVFNHASAGYIVYGNPDLEPETSKNYQLSFEYHYGGNALSRLSFFYNDLRNLIEFDSVTANEEFYTGIYRYGNILEAWVAGFELERHFRLSQRLELDLAYTYLESRNREHDTPLLRRPSHSGRWTAAYRRGDWNGTLWGRYTSRMLYQSIWSTDDVVSTEWTLPYHIWSVNVSRELGDGWTIYTKAENLFNYFHSRYGPRMGRTVNVGVRWSLRQDK